VIPHFLVLSLLSYGRPSKKPLLFKSFIGLTVQEFDEIHDKAMIKDISIMIYNVYLKEHIEKETLVL
jgi:hypothetical protein